MKKYLLVFLSFFLISVSVANATESASTDWELGDKCYYSGTNSPNNCNNLLISDTTNYITLNTSGTTQKYVCLGFSQNYFNNIPANSTIQSANFKMRIKSLDTNHYQWSLTRSMIQNPFDWSAGNSFPSTYSWTRYITTSFSGQNDIYTVNFNDTKPTLTDLNSGNFYACMATNTATTHTYAVDYMAVQFNYTSEIGLEYPDYFLNVDSFSIASESSTITASVSGALSIDDVQDEDFCVYSFYNSLVSSQLNTGPLLAHVIVDNAIIINGQYVVIGGGAKDLTKLDLTAPIYYGIGNTRGWYQNITFPASYGSPFNLQSSYTCYYSDYDGDTLTGYSSTGSTNHTDVPGSPTHEDMQDSYACDPGSNFFSLFLCQQISSFKIWVINQFTIPSESISFQINKFKNILATKAPFAYVYTAYTATFSRASVSPLDISASDFSVFNFNFLGTEYNITTPPFVTSLFLVVRKTILIVLFTMFITYLFSVGRRIYGQNT